MNKYASYINRLVFETKKDDLFQNTHHFRLSVYVTDKLGRDDSETNLLTVRNDEASRDLRDLATSRKLTPVPCV